MLTCAGVVRGMGVYAFSKRMLSSANVSMFGVVGKGYPYVPTWSALSVSRVTSMILGFSPLEVFTESPPMYGFVML